jgi:hypothetical protein
MPSQSRPIRNLLLIVVFQLGLCIVVLGDVANAARGYGTTLPGVAQLLGATTAVLAVVAFFVRSSPDSDSDRSPE